MQNCDILNYANDPAGVIKLKVLPNLRFYNLKNLVICPSLFVFKHS